MKLCCIPHCCGFPSRSFAGAWIEITVVSIRDKKRRGRSFAGAWIEILHLVGRQFRTVLVAPSRERGLKSQENGGCNKYNRRSFAGAWIEILRFSASFCLCSSRSFAGAWIEIRSSDLQALQEIVAPSRERGLKYCVLKDVGLCCRRSFAGAWIEIIVAGRFKGCGKCRSFAGAWIEIFAILARSDGFPVAPSRERGLKLNSNVRLNVRPRRSFAGAWIEIVRYLLTADSISVAPSRERGLK